METGWRMANKMYEEEDIRAIAKKIKSLAPLLRDGAFTVAEMSRGIERVFEEGERKGRNEGYGAGYNSGFLRGKDEGYKGGYSEGHTEGYEDGYIVGRENSQGVELPPLASPGTADDLVEGKQLIDGEGNIVEGTIPTRSSDNVGLIGLEVTVPEGYYPERVEKTIDADRIYMAGHTEGYSTGYSEGLTAGAENVKRDEAKTAEDVSIYLGDRDEVVADIPVGYYNTKVEKRLDISTYLESTYDDGWNSGYNRGSEVGYNEGFDAGVESVVTYEDGNEVAY